MILEHFGRTSSYQKDLKEIIIILNILINFFGEPNSNKKLTMLKKATAKSQVLNSNGIPKPSQKFRLYS
jgi:hypothetical protein